MSRTTKPLRALLMRKSSSFIWERARLGMEGLPPMIEGFNEPQYANLLFDTHCHVRTFWYETIPILIQILELLESANQVRPVDDTHQAL